MRAFIAFILVGIVGCYPAVQQSDDPVVQYWYGKSDQGSGSSGSGGSQQAPGQGVAHGGSSGAVGGYRVPLTQLGEQGVVAASPEDEPFFTDVSNLEPVYDYKSKSRYQHGRVVYYQTRYNPTEPLYDVYYGNQYVPAQTDTPQYIKY